MSGKEKLAISEQFRILGIKLSIKFCTSSYIIFFWNATVAPNFKTFILMKIVRFFDIINIIFNLSVKILYNDEYV